MRKWIYPFLFLMLVAAILERSLNEIYVERHRMELQKQDLIAQKTRALARKKSLELQIMSQSDPRWITLTLIRVMGVVPEGQKKFYFKDG
ncbi:MAG: hypothetical protein KDK62_01340 [Chlamydiia bacterium]|nr:hypothetical protein [Chlamydiia bacterium]